MSNINPGNTPNGDDTPEQPESTPPVGASSDPARPDLAPNEDGEPEDSRYESTPTDGENSVLVDDPAYVGVDTEYRNAAYEQLAPMQSQDEDQKAVEEAAKDHEVIRAVEGENVGFRGYAPDTPHPSERENPADKYINANRKVLENQAKR